MARKRLVVIGDEIDGIQAAARAVRENPEIEAKVLIPGEHLSFNRYILAYFIQNSDEDVFSFMGSVMENFKAHYGIEIITHVRVTGILPLERKVVFEGLEEGSSSAVEYDRLLIAAGLVPTVPEVEGINLGNVVFLGSLNDVMAIQEGIKAGQIKKAVVVGAGMAGVYTAESLWKRGVKVTLVEKGPQILPELDMEMAELVKKQMVRKGVEVLVGEKVLSLIGNAKGDVVEVHTPEHILPADLVIWLEDMRPSVEMARKAGIIIGASGAIEVDQYMETNVPGIYAVGSCAQRIHHITGKPVCLYRQAVDDAALKVVSENIASGNSCTLEKGVLGTMSIQAFDLGMARTGLSLQQAREEGYEVETAIVSVYDDRYAYGGSYRENAVKLMVDRSNGKILGVQCVGGVLSDKLVDTVAAVMSMGGTVRDLAVLDVANHFSYSMNLHPIALVAHVMLNKLKGKFKGISPFELNDIMQNEEAILLDVRTGSEFKMGTLPGAINIPLEELEARKDELDRQRNIILISERGRRAYLAYIRLRQMGFERLSVLDGGLLLYPFE